MTIETTQGNTMMNQGYDAVSVIQMRLDTTTLLATFEAYLRGTRINGYLEDKGMVKPVFEKFGEPRMNERGIQDVMSWMSNLINSQTVQGNIPQAEFSDLIANIHEDFACSLSNNQPYYEVSDEDYDGIVDQFVNTLHLFISRTKDNLERESYAATIRTLERVGEEKKGFGWNPFAKKNG